MCFIACLGHFEGEVSCDTHVQAIRNIIRDHLHGFANNQSYEQTTEGFSFALKISLVISPEIMPFFSPLTTSVIILNLQFSRERFTLKEEQTYKNFLRIQNII